LAASAAIGALWGAIAFLLLWGYTSIQLTRRDVDSVVWTIALLPVRLVLFAIHVVEDHVVHHPFHFADNHDWIGVVSAAVGALIALTAVAVIRVTLSSIRRGMRRGGSSAGRQRSGTAHAQP